MSDPGSTTVLVTGGSGFIASYVILELLSQGFIVRTTVRSLSRETSVRDALTNGGATASDQARLSFIAASLEDEAGWQEAVQGCRYVQHIASPVPAAVPKHEDDIIIPAREGALRILRAAAAADVKRVVLTSSASAVVYGHPPSKEPFTEESWTVLDGKEKLDPYPKSKTIAERAAWDFINSDANHLKMELATVCPFLVLGPVLGKDIATSVLVVKKLMDGSMPGCPNLNWSIVDVRDVASLHVLAMTKSEAAGQRFQAAPNDEDNLVSMVHIGQIIKANRPDKAKKIPRFQIPDFVVRGISFFDKAVGVILPDLGKVRLGSNRKARESLGWLPRRAETSVLDTVDSLVKYKLV